MNSKFFGESTAEFLSQRQRESTPSKWGWPWSKTCHMIQAEYLHVIQIFAFLCLIQIISVRYIDVG